MIEGVLLAGEEVGGGGLCLDLRGGMIVLIRDRVIVLMVSLDNPASNIQICWSMGLCQLSSCRTVSRLDNPASISRYVEA